MVADDVAVPVNGPQQLRMLLRPVPDDEKVALTPSLRSAANTWGVNRGSGTSSKVRAICFTSGPRNLKVSEYFRRSSPRFKGFAEAGAVSNESVSSVKGPFVVNALEESGNKQRIQQNKAVMTAQIPAEIIRRLVDLDIANPLLLPGNRIINWYAQETG